MAKPNNEESENNKKENKTERIGWDHPFIQLTGTAPGYLVRPILRYSEAYWPKWLKKNPTIWEERNREAWIFLKLLGNATSDLEDEEKNKRPLDGDEE